MTAQFWCPVWWFVNYELRFPTENVFLYRHDSSYQLNNWWQHKKNDPYWKQNRFRIDVYQSEPYKMQNYTQATGARIIKQFTRCDIAYVCSILKWRMKSHSL